VRRQCFSQQRPFKLTPSPPRRAAHSTARCMLIIIIVLLLLPGAGYMIDFKGGGRGKKEGILYPSAGPDPWISSHHWFLPKQLLLSSLPNLFVHLIILRQVHSLFQSEFAT
jgi:hypothetical protein